MKLVVTEKNDAATKIASLLGASKPKADKVYSTPIYRFEVDGEEWVTIGLRGHILEPDFTPNLVYKKRGGWQGVTVEGETVPADVPASLAKPPFKKKKPFTEDGVELKGWKMDALPYLVYAPIEKLPKEKEIIRSLKNLAKKADSIVIATDFDREGELIGSDALSCIQEVNPTAPVSRVLQPCGARRQPGIRRCIAPGYRPYLGRGAHALSHPREVCGLRQRALVGPRADADACPHRGARA